MKIILKIALAILVFAVCFIPSAAGAVERPAAIRFGNASIGTGGRPVSGGGVPVSTAIDRLAFEASLPVVHTSIWGVASGCPVAGSRRRSIRIGSVDRPYTMICHAAVGAITPDRNNPEAAWLWFVADNVRLAAENIHSHFV